MNRGGWKYREKDGETEISRLFPVSSLQEIKRKEENVCYHLLNISVQNGSGDNQRIKKHFCARDYKI